MKEGARKREKKKATKRGKKGERESKTDERYFFLEYRKMDLTTGVLLFFRKKKGGEQNFR